MTDEFDVNEKNIQDQNTGSGENKAKLDKDDSADELLNSLEEIIGGSEDNAGEEPDSNIKTDFETKSDPEPEDDFDDLDDLDISGNELDDKDSIEKAALDKEGRSEDIFIKDRATLDMDGMPEGSLANDKAQIDTDGPPEPENKKEKKKSSQDEVKQVEPDDESLQTSLQKIIARIKQFSSAKIRIVVSSVMAVLLFCIGVLFFILFSGSDQEKTEELFADSAPASEIIDSDTASLIENYELKTFVIPMQDFARDRVFFKADFIIMIDKVDLIQFKNNNVKIREAVYNLFYNKNSEIISKKLKRSEQIYKLKNVLNLIFKKEIIKGIEMVNYKVV
jgi:hypothetical protein